ncbi:MAG TPA: sulfatase-like hydrolase/transferase, partial [Cytophagales bacterium]
TPAGPFNRWPTGRGFDHFYGFLSGSTDQWHPLVWEDTRKLDLEPNKKHFTTLIADKAIQYIGEQKTVAPDKPFFLYFAPGAGHAPHQVAKEWSDKYKGKFDQGWDAYRQEVLSRQIKLGVVPKNTALPERHESLKAWESLSANEKKLYARFMEVYAGFVSHTDYEISRVIHYLQALEQLENTLIFVSVGDNGGSKEGTFVGRIGSYDPNWTEEQQLRKNLAEIDLIGTEKSRVNYPLGWSQATNTPFKHWKQDANSEGGTHNPLIIFYPKGIKEKGGIRTQYSHLIDILPTTVELTGVTIPSVINGYPQEPMEGTSLAYSINTPDAPSRHTVQHYEIRGSRSIYKDGWKAGTLHVKGQPFAQDKWELYNLNEDWNELNDLAAKHPEKLKELQELFDAQAWKYNIYPLKDENIPSIPPTVYENTDRIVLYPGTGPVFDGLAPRILNRSYSLTAEVELGKATEGVLLSTGGWAGGLSFFVQHNTLQLVYNNGVKKVHLKANKPLPTGKASLRFSFAYDGGQPGSGGTGTLYVNNEKVAEGRIAKTLKNAVDTYETIELGRDIISPVTDKYKVPYAFTGKLDKVVIELKNIQTASR